MNVPGSLYKEKKIEGKNLDMSHAQENSEERIIHLKVGDVSIENIFLAPSVILLTPGRVEYALVSKR